MFRRYGWIKEEILGHALGIPIIMDQDKGTQYASVLFLSRNANAASYNVISSQESGADPSHRNYRIWTWRISSSPRSAR